MSARKILPLIALAALLAVGAATASAAHRARAADTPKRGGSLTIARIEDSQSFDKTTVFQNESIWLTEQINETLFSPGNDGVTLRPWLATSYKESEDGLTYTLKRRPKLNFHEGTSLNAVGVNFVF